jgi:hypothetical protein
MRKLLVIQPWFSAIGHPAQSLLNMASAIGWDERIVYLVSRGKDPSSFQKPIERLKSFGDVVTFNVETSTGESNTSRSLWTILKMRIKGHKFERILFFDGSLVVLAKFWPFFSFIFPAKRLSLIYLYGPEHIRNRSWRVRLMVKRFLRRRDVKLYLRTEELAQAWIDSYRDVLTVINISTLPSLEIPDGSLPQQVSPATDQVTFGVIGQIRPGKSLEWLVPIFQKHPSLGRLTVAGEFYSSEVHVQLSFLDSFKGFINHFMSEDEMRELAAKQDYLLMLYDGLWDKRMESAVMYLAASVDRPVVVYGDSWCGRMVNEYQCGIVAPIDRDGTLELLKKIPRRESPEYAKLIKGMDGFRRAHSVESLRDKVVEELLG